MKPGQSHEKISKSKSQKLYVSGLSLFENAYWKKIIQSFFENANWEKIISNVYQGRKITSIFQIKFHQKYVGK